MGLPPLPAETTRAAAAALRKQQAGQKPTREESRALARVRQHQAEQQRWETYRSIPQKDWISLSQRQAKQLREQSSTYGFAFGPAIDLGEFLRWFHKFLADNGSKLLAEDDDDLLEGEATPALERLRAAKADLAELERDERRRNLLRRQVVHDLLGRVAGVLRNCGEQLQQQFGPDALEILNEHLTSAEAEISRLFADESHSPEG